MQEVSKGIRLQVSGFSNEGLMPLLTSSSLFPKTALNAALAP